MIEGIRRLRKYVCLHTHENVSGPSNDFDNSARPLDVLTIADAIEREVEERYIEGPKDKDGMPIHIGDKVYTAHGGTYEVARITREDYYGATTWYIEDFASHFSLGPEDLTHHRPLTVEDVLREIVTNAELRIEAARESWESRCPMTENGRMTDYERGVAQASNAYMDVIRSHVTENAKLREYANILAKSAMMYGPCDWCPYKDDEDACGCDTLPMRDGCKFNDELRKLGIEVAG